MQIKANVISTRRLNSLPILLSEKHLQWFIWCFIGINFMSILLTKSTKNSTLHNIAYARLMPELQKTTVRHSGNGRNKRVSHLQEWNKRKKIYKLSMYTWISEYIKRTLSNKVSNVSQLPTLLSTLSSIGSRIIAAPYHTPLVSFCFYSALVRETTRVLGIFLVIGKLYCDNRISKYNVWEKNKTHGSCRDVPWCNWMVWMPFAIWWPLSMSRSTIPGKTTSVRLINLCMQACSFSSSSIIGELISLLLLNILNPPIAMRYS